VGVALLYADTRTGKHEKVTSLHSQLLRECVERGYNWQHCVSSTGFRIQESRELACPSACCSCFLHYELWDQLSVILCEWTELPTSFLLPLLLLRYLPWLTSQFRKLSS